ncbi:carboxypeptidase-like regulatory domain-containing protein [Paraflavisolibacter sp. H34]|uniref:carboxypeptidase-like regulatory domain-containing protein n=1 Tax=Huijunlia imazamoxiresistens TaxID=3127457 RepID=UPI003019B0F3
MKKMLLLLGCFIAACTGVKANGTEPGEPPAETIRKKDVNGGVFHSQSKKPLENVSVTAFSKVKKEQVAHTNRSGNYTFNGLQPGVYKLVFEKDGFKKVTKEKVVVKTDETYQMDVEMIREKDFIFLPGTFSF